MVNRRHIEAGDSRYAWQGELVRLRPLRLDDAERNAVRALDSPTRRLLQMGLALPTSVDLEAASLEEYLGCKDTGGVIVFAIDTHAGETVGGVSYHSRHRTNGTFGFGILIDREHRQRGYARDAVRILLRYAFWERRYQKCDSACLAGNEASIRLHEALGFVEEGRRRRQVFVDGAYHDEVLFGLTREEFDAREEGQ